MNTVHSMGSWMPPMEEVSTEEEHRKSLKVLTQETQEHCKALTVLKGYNVDSASLLSWTKFKPTDVII